MKLGGTNGGYASRERVCSNTTHLAAACRLVPSRGARYAARPPARARLSAIARIRRSVSTEVERGPLGGGVDGLGQFFVDLVHRPGDLIRLAGGDLAH